MNRFKLKIVLASELKRVNRMIDLKIARGLPYRTEARRHRSLVRQLDSLARERAFAFF